MRSEGRVCSSLKTCQWSKGTSISFIPRTRCLSSRTVSREIASQSSVELALVLVRQAPTSTREEAPSLTTLGSKRRSWKIPWNWLFPRAPGTQTKNWSQPSAQSSQDHLSPKKLVAWTSESKIRSMEILGRDPVKQAASWSPHKLCRQVTLMVWSTKTH